MRFTILGAHGFIGSHLLRELKRRGIDVSAPSRDEWSGALKHAGHLIYCVGLTADFRSRPNDAMRAHAGLLADALDQFEYESFLYLSSTRLYRSDEDTGEERSFVVDPRSFDDLYNLSKLAGEALIFARRDPATRVVRLSNVYGHDWSSSNFLSSVIRTAVDEGIVTLRTTPDSTKDYVSVDDVAGSLIDIATLGRQSLYNIASGIATTNGEIAEALQRAGYRVGYETEAVRSTLPAIDISRIRNEFGFSPRALSQALPS